MKKRTIILSIAALLCCNMANAVQDSLTISLLTCSPGPIIYEQYGHTAIRVQGKNQDLVFNYGVFDFSAPFFGFRFALGKTDYMLGVERYSDFQESYGKRGSYIYSQELLLTQDETDKLYTMLMENSMPTRRTYRYNIFYKNCTTCALDIIFRATGTTPHYPVPNQPLTTREMVHRYNENYCYSKTGIDFLLGSSADTVLSAENSYFLPLEAMNLASTMPQLFAPVQTISEPETALVEPHYLLTPNQLMILLSLIVLLICSIEWYRGNLWWGVDIAIFGIQGLIGLLVLFMVLFSKHPTTSPNLLLIIFNPVPLCFLPATLLKLKREQLDYFLIVEAIASIGFILINPLLPQKFDQVTLIFAAIIALRSLSNILLSFFAKKIIDKRNNYIKQNHRFLD